MACLFGHKWDGCKCSKCGETRNEQHTWRNGKCGVCGKTQQELFGGQLPQKTKNLIYDATQNKTLEILKASIAKSISGYALAAEKEIDVEYRGGFGKSAIHVFLNDGIVGEFSKQQPRLRVKTNKRFNWLFLTSLDKSNAPIESSYYIFIVDNELGTGIIDIVANGDFNASNGVLNFNKVAQSGANTLQKYLDEETKCAGSEDGKHEFKDGKCVRCDKTISAIVAADLADSKWSLSSSGPNKYYSTKLNSLLEANEALKRLEAIPALTYYLADTPDGTLGRDIEGYFTEAPVKTKGLYTKNRAYGKAGEAVESESLKGFGDIFKVQQMVAHQKVSGQYAKLVLMMKCGHCGYESPVETEAGDLERECYFCGTNNKAHRGSVNVFIGGGVVEI